MMTVHQYLNELVDTDVVREQILKHRPKLERLLSDYRPPLVEKISDFDLDVIEVSDGCAFRISARAFFEYEEEDFRGKCAHAFVPMCAVQWAKPPTNIERLPLPRTAPRHWQISVEKYEDAGVGENPREEYNSVQGSNDVTPTRQLLPDFETVTA
ncbi:Hypothetical predicted protein, partial [Paramuricea clavata]